MNCLISDTDKSKAISRLLGETTIAAIEAIDASKHWEMSDGLRSLLFVRKGDPGLECYLPEQRKAIATHIFVRLLPKDEKALSISLPHSLPADPTRLMLEMDYNVVLGQALQIENSDSIKSNPLGVAVTVLTALRALNSDWSISNKEEPDRKFIAQNVERVLMACIEDFPKESQTFKRCSWLNYTRFIQWTLTPGLGIIAKCWRGYYDEENNLDELFRPFTDFLFVACTHGALPAYVSGLDCFSFHPELKAYLLDIIARAKKDEVNSRELLWACYETKPALLQKLYKDADATNEVDQLVQQLQKSGEPYLAAAIQTMCGQFTRTEAIEFLDNVVGDVSIGKDEPLFLKLLWPSKNKAMDAFKEVAKTAETKHKRYLLVLLSGLAKWQYDFGQNQIEKSSNIADGLLRIIRETSSDPDLVAQALMISLTDVDPPRFDPDAFFECTKKTPSLSLLVAVAALKARQQREGKRELEAKYANRT